MLVHRPELCVVDARGVTVLVLLTNMRPEWFAEVDAAYAEMALRYGGPRPLVSLVKLDRRFPLDIGFDQNLVELRRALALALPHLSASAVIVSFGGVLGFVMRRALQVIGFLGHRQLPTTVCSTAAEAVAWIEPYATPTAAGAFDPGRCLDAIQDVEALLECRD